MELLSELDISLPEGAWDSHVHVADEVSRYRIYME